MSRDIHEFYRGGIPEILAALYDKPATFQQLRSLLSGDERCMTTRCELLELADAGYLKNGSGTYRITKDGRDLVEKWLRTS